jgi:hypothetical protein
MLVIFGRLFYTHITSRELFNIHSRLLVTQNNVNRIWAANKSVSLLKL